VIRLKDYNRQHYSKSPLIYNYFA